MSYNLGKVVGKDGNGIKDIMKTSTSGLNDIYTITMDDDTTYTFVVRNGQDAADIVTSWESTLSDAKIPSEKLVKDTIDTKVNISDIVDNLTSTNTNKPLSAKQGKALKDLIGDAITYINQ